MTPNPYNDVYEQLADDTAFLWVLRQVALEQPHYFPEDIIELEARIEGQFDAFTMAPEEAWTICENALSLEDGGETFTAAVLAFRSRDVRKIQIAVESAAANEQTHLGLATALAWLPGKYVHDWMKKFFASKDLHHKNHALVACGLRSENPEHYLTRLLQREDCRELTPLYCNALLSIGVFKRRDLIDDLQRAVNSGNSQVAVAGAVSSALLGDQSALPLLANALLEESDPNRVNFFAEILFRAAPVAKGREWISELANQGQLRSVIKATGALGDPHAVPWLVEKMQDAKLARLAGEAFTTITGIGLDEKGLAIDIPDIEEIAPDIDEDTDTTMDEDENLSFPDADKVAALWQKYGSHFQSGTRYFYGKPATPEYLQACVAQRPQRCRHRAAIQLALLKPEQPLFNTRSRLLP